MRRYWEYPGADVDRASEIYHGDAVLEFPQSGERFEGVATFTEWRRQYPADDVSYRVRRITAREDLAVVEVSVSYEGGPWMYGVQLLEFQDDKVARERIYVMDGWEAPEWRAPWRAEAPADPPEALTSSSVPSRPATVSVEARGSRLGHHATGETGHHIGQLRAPVGSDRIPQVQGQRRTIARRDERT